MKRIEMDKKLSDFVNRDCGKIDISEVEGIPEDEFIKIYNNEIRELFDDYKKSSGKCPVCSKCGLDIQDSKNLIKYFGNVLHSDCFAEVYREVGKGLRGYERTFFDKVLDLIVQQESP